MARMLDLCLSDAFLPLLHGVPKLEVLFICAALVLLAVGGYLSRLRFTNGRRAVWQSFWICVCAASAIVLGILSFEIGHPLGLWVWVGIGSSTSALGLLLFWFLVDPFLPYVEGPAALFVLGSCTVIGMILAALKTAQSQVFTPTWLVSTFFGGVGSFYINKSLNDRKLIKEVLSPFSAQVARFRCVLTLFLHSEGKELYYKGKGEKGAACFLFEAFAFVRAMDIKKEKMHNIKLLAALHDACVRVCKKMASFVPFEFQDCGASIARDIKSSQDFLQLMRSDSLPGALTSLKTDVYDKLSKLFDGPTQPQGNDAQAVEASNAQEAQEARNAQEAQEARNAEAVNAMEAMEGLIASLDDILEEFGFSIKIKSLV